MMLQIYEFQKHSAFIRKMIEKARPFVLFRMPMQKNTYCFIPGKIRMVEYLECFASIEDEVFVFAPFSPDAQAVIFEDSLSWEEVNYLEGSAVYESNGSFKDLLNPTKENDYIAEVEKMIAFLKDGQAKKVVLSAIFSKQFKVQHSSPLLFDFLSNEHPGAFVYLAFIPNYGLWIGASPELLLSYEGQHLKSMALAGSVPRFGDKKWGEKEKLEHDYVVEFILQNLLNAGCTDIEKKGPQIIQAGEIEHMCTTFEALGNFEQAVKLVVSMHPTPAVCGVPREEAFQIILQTEKHPRLLYSGFLGIVSKQFFRLFVNLRCAKLDPQHAWIFAGAGITSQSNPTAEWDEVCLKSRTIANALEKTETFLKNGDFYP